MNKSFKKMAWPYLVWLLLLTAVPTVFMLVLSFCDIEGIDFEEASFSFSAFAQLSESSTLIAFLNSFLYASLATIICIVIGYIVAYQLFKSKINNKFLCLTLLILPMWSNILLRTEALGNILEPNNIVNDLLSKIGLGFSLDLRGTGFAVLIGLVFTYLPFMILCIYNALEKIDYSLEEASLDLGLTKTKTFWHVTFPLSVKGIVTGSIMVFLPCFSGFAIPEIMGKGNIVLIGNIIDQFFKNMNYNIGSLLAIIILVIILGAICLVDKFDKDGETLL